MRSFLIPARASRWSLTARSDAIEARGRELARERVLLRRVVRGEEGEALAEIVADAVAEGEAPSAAGRGHRPQRRQGCRPWRSSRGPVRTEPRARARTPGAGSRDSGRVSSGWACWRAERSDEGRDVDVLEAQAVVARDGRGLVREARAMKRREQEVARAVSGEHAAGAVAAVGRGSEAHDEEARPRVTEARHRAAPVVLVAEALTFSRARATLRHHSRRRGHRSHSDDVASDPGEGVSGHRGAARSGRP